MTLRNFKEVEAALRPFVPLVAQLTGGDMTLDRIRPLMEVIGHPETRLRVIHIAGTSGKTSTAYYTAALLGASGKSVGLTVSPHIDSIAERVQINGSPMDEAAFCAELGIFLDFVATVAEPPSYFELLYAFALWEFDRQKVDYAVIETGMGGLHDATNIVTRADKVCVITDIGFDHQHVLGNTIEAIAAQKAGIIHKDNHVLTYSQGPAVMGVIEQRVRDHGAILDVVKSNNSDYVSEDLPLFQRRNWQLADAVYRYLSERDGLIEIDRDALLVTQALQVPARMDAVTIQGKTLVMDGAHNGQKMIAFTEAFRAKYPNIKPVILLALKNNKYYEEVVPCIAELASKVIVTSFASSQDLPARSIDPRILAEAFRGQGFSHVEVINDEHHAFQTLLEATDEVGVITGSFYLLSQMRSSEHLK